MAFFEELWSLFRSSPPYGLTIFLSLRDFRGFTGSGIREFFSSPMFRDRLCTLFLENCASPPPLIEF